jgi:protein-L-isoaspartate O-methyltransferase
MVIPVGRENGIQRLVLVTKLPDRFEQEALEAVSFVPLVRNYKST